VRLEYLSAILTLTVSTLTARIAAFAGLDLPETGQVAKVDYNVTV